MFYRVSVIFIVLAMLFGAAGCSPQNQANVEAWNTLFFGSEIELQNQPTEFSETILDVINEYIGENCPLRQDYDFDSTGEIYTVCRDYDGEMIEVRASDIVMLGVTATTFVTPIPGDELIAIKWAWNAEKTAKVIIAVIFTAEAAHTIGVVYSRHSHPDHDPRISQVARDRITKVWNDIQLRLSDPEGKTGPIIYCAVVTFQNNVQYIRVLSTTVDDAVGTMAWFGTNGWSGALGNKDISGFMNGNPRGAISYNPNLPLRDCLYMLGKIPPSNQYTP